MFLRRRYRNGKANSNEIHSMIEVVLSDTGFEQAALALHEHRMTRQIKRRRLEVIRGVVTRWPSDQAEPDSVSYLTMPRASIHCANCRE